MALRLTRDLVKTLGAGPTPEFLTQQVWVGLRICISDKCCSWLLLWATREPELRPNHSFWRHSAPLPARVALCRYAGHTVRGHRGWLLLSKAVRCFVNYEINNLIFLLFQYSSFIFVFIFKFHRHLLNRVKSLKNQRIKRFSCSPSKLKIFYSSCNKKYM